jgi:hypothetical protein
MPDNFRRVDAPDVLATFAGFSEMMDRLHVQPVTVTPQTIGPIMYQKPWAYQEDRLVEMYRLGWSYKRMADELGRTVNACRAHLRMIGYGRV